MRRILDLFFQRESEYERRFHQRAREIGQQEFPSIVDRINAVHAARRRIEAEVEQNRPAVPNLVISELGEFTPQFESLSHRTAYFICQIEFRNQQPELVVYPGWDGNAPSQGKQRQLVQQLDDFTNCLDSALVAFRRNCKKYALTTE